MSELQVDDKVFVLNPDAKAMDIQNSLEERLLQLEAMAHVMSAESFPTWSDEIQNNYVWALRRKVEEMGHLHSALMERLKPYVVADLGSAD